MSTVQNPLSRRERRVIKSNATMSGMDCPNPDCALTVNVCDVSDSGELYVSHEEDGVGLDSRTARGETDGCHVSPENDPTL